MEARQAAHSSWEEQEEKQEQPAQWWERTRS